MFVSYLIETLLQEKSKQNQKKLEQCSGECDAAKTLHLHLKEALSKLEEEKDKHHEAEGRVKKAMMETRNLERALLEKTQDEDEKGALEEQIDKLSMKVAKSEEELEVSTKKFQKLKEEVGVERGVLCCTLVIVIVTALWSRSVDQVLAVRSR